MKKFRLYFDSDLELEWIMNMVNSGWALKRFFLGVYTFEPCTPGEYIYQIDLLKSWTKNHEDYREFMVESNVEIVTQWFRWIILRKKASDGPFELYTDTESLKARYLRIKRMFIGVLIIEIICFLDELYSAITLQSYTFGCVTLLIAVLVFVIFRAIMRAQWKIRELERK